MQRSTTNWEAFNELVKERVDLVEFIGQYTTLTKAGSEWKGLCPFHNEKTPSFGVNAERGVWNCFGCGKGGNIYTFLKEKEGLDFREAAQLLSERYHIPLTVDPKDQQQRTEIGILRDLHEAAQQYFVKTLFSEAGAPFRDYLKEREFHKADAEKFGLGAALDDWEALSRHLMGKGFTKEQLISGGLASQSTKYPDRCMDRFRSRLMIPIRDAMHRPIAFGGRIVGSDDGAKYLNSPETPLFKKNQTLFALDIARTAIRDRDGCLLMEGYTDVMRAHQKGAGNAIAAMGTALTPNQIAQIQKYSQRITLVMDSDQAGLKAAFKHATALVAQGMDVRVAILKGVKDPDEFLRTHTLEEFEARIAKARPALEFMLQSIVPSPLPTETRDRYDIVRRAGPILQLLPKPYQREERALWFAEVLGMRAEQVLAELRPWIVGQSTAHHEEAPSQATESIPLTQASPLERDLMRLIVADPGCRELAVGYIRESDFSNPAYQQMVRLLHDEDFPLDAPSLMDLTLFQQFPTAQGLLTYLLSTDGDPISLSHCKRLLCKVREGHALEDSARLRHRLEVAEASDDMVTRDALMRQQERLGRLMQLFRKGTWPEDTPEGQDLVDPRSN